MNVAIGVGGAVMEGEKGTLLSLLALQGINIHVFPALEPFGLALGQTSAHREFGFRQEERGRIVFFGRAGCGVVHGSAIGLEELRAF